MEFPHQGYYSAKKHIKLSLNQCFHNIAHILHWDRRGQLWGDWGAADSSVVKSAKRGRDNDLI